MLRCSTFKLILILIIYSNIVLIYNILLTSSVSIVNLLKKSKITKKHEILVKYMKNVNLPSNILLNAINILVVMIASFTSYFLILLLNFITIDTFIISKIIIVRINLGWFLFFSLILISQCMSHYTTFQRFHHLFWFIASFRRIINA